jgi:hypothetical protein
MEKPRRFVYVVEKSIRFAGDKMPVMVGVSHQAGDSWAEAIKMAIEAGGPVVESSRATIRDVLEPKTPQFPTIAIGLHFAQPKTDRAGDTLVGVRISRVEVGR